MALSGTRDAGDTVATITVDVLRHLFVLEDEDTADAIDAAKVLRAMRNMLRTWQVDGVRLWLTEDQTITPVASTASYALAIRATEVIDAWRRSSGSDTPIKLYTRQEYNDLPNKSAEGSPYALFADRDRTATTCYLYPVPNAASAANETIYVTCRIPLQDALATGDEVDIPPEWVEALGWGTAKRLLAQYPGLEPDQRAHIHMMADETYAVLSGADREVSVMMRPRRY